MPRISVGAALALLLSIAAANAEDGAGILPHAVSRPPAYESLATGPLRVRLFPGQRAPCLQHYVNLDTPSSVANLVAAVERHGIQGSWAIMSTPTSGWLVQLVETGLPMCCYFAMQPVLNHERPLDPATRAALDDVARTHRAFYTFGICEWENAFFRHWQPETDTTATFGVTPAELGCMDRAENYAVVARTARRWKESLGGRMMMANGYGMLSHLAEIGLDAVGVETSETIPATQVKRAFARGAARQFGIPWFEEVSVWFGASVSGGMPEATIPLWPDTPVGGQAGHSASHLRRHWFTAWFSGVNHVMLEASPRVLFEVPWTGEFPADAPLSRYGQDARLLAELMARVDVGVPYTPFAVLVGKHHGRWSVWGKPWGRLEATAGDAMTERFFDQVFPGQSLGPGREERYLCPSPYGDTFDVVVNDADRTSWHGYPVILAVGDIAWTPEDVRFLLDHARAGGIVALNEIHLAGWDRAVLGLAAEGFTPTREARTVLASPDGVARAIRRDIGRGCLLVFRTTPEGDQGRVPAFPQQLLDELADRYLPFRVSGDVQTLLNRTPEGWAVTVVNNKGITKDLHVDRPPAIDASAAQHVVISFREPPVAVSDLITGDALAMDVAGGRVLRFVLPPGEMRLVAVKE
ncbi:MAG: hypothetical protein ACKO4Z_12710 [Planctomycetota bacterium]